jgi:acyl dehydratase
MSTHDGSPRSSASRHFEDFETGTTYELGSCAVTAEAIIAFARQFDPQFFHTDEEAAKESAFGGLIASGWHTSVMWMRLFVDAVLSSSASIASPGVDELRWRVPVRPGDVLSGTFTVTKTEPSVRRPERGTVHGVGELTNQHGEVVMRLRNGSMFWRRTAPAGEARG